MAERPTPLQIRNQRVVQHLNLVDPISHHYARCSAESSDDLRQVALLGLIRAAERYQAERRVPFAAYARPHIRGAVLHYLRDLAPMLRASRRLQEQHRRLQQQRAELSGQLGRPPLAQELQQALGLSTIQWQRLEEYQTLRRMQQLPEEAHALEAEGSWQEPNPPEAAEPSCCLQALASLPAELQVVVRAVVLEGRSLRTLAREQGSSASTLHRRLQQGLAELRRQLNAASALPGS